MTLHQITRCAVDSDTHTLRSMLARAIAHADTFAEVAGYREHDTNAWIMDPDAERMDELAESARRVLHSDNPETLDMLSATVLLVEVGEHLRRYEDGPDDGTAEQVLAPATTAREVTLDTLLTRYANTLHVAPF